jgi:hypothetical protein
VKALTLWQPWASAIALGVKTIETRSWWTSYRGPLAIHAAKRPMGVEELELAAKLFRDLDGRLPPWPFGAVVAVAVLVDCVPTERLPGWRREGVTFAPREDLWGNFTPGRFGWILRNVMRLPAPCPERGRQGLWEWRTL